MDYFQIYEMEGPCVSINTGFDKNIQAICQERLGDIENMCIYPVQIPESICMPDILFRPTFLVSEPCWECIQHYEPYIEARRCVLHSSDHSGIFYIPLLDLFGQPLDKKELFNRHIFQIVVRHARQTIVSLELLESILRRNFISFHVSEF